MISYEQIRANHEISTYIEKADQTLIALGYTEHSYAHVGKCAKFAGEFLTELGYPERTAELARIAGYIHDVGNVVNRANHAQSGAVMAFRILDKMGMEVEEVAVVVTAIGHHDESNALPVNEVAAALILADKSDVRRSRVRNKDLSSFDIHDRVNFAVEDSQLILRAEHKTVTLELVIDNTISTVMDYFEIFLNRMILCRKAAAYFDLTFQLVINGVMVM